MKNFLLLFVLAISIDASAGISNQQILTATPPGSTTPAFSFLRGHKQNVSDYSLQWSMTNTTGINHYEIESTYEDPFDFYANWTNLGNVVGTRSNIVRFTDVDVIPGFISYRVIAVFDNGQTIVSEIFCTTID